MTDRDAFLATFATLAILKLMLFVHRIVGPLVSFHRKQGDDQEHDDGDRRP